jgi:hypothetical protein
MHVASAYRPDGALSGTNPDREHDENASAVFLSANRLESILRLGMPSVRQDDDRSAENLLDLGGGQPVFPAVLPVAIVPIEPQDIYGPRHLYTFV